MENALRRIRDYSVLIRSTWKRFSRIDGPQWGAALAYYTFFSLFPSIVLFVTIASAFIDQGKATSEIIGFINAYLPLAADNRKDIANSITAMMAARQEAGAVAIIILVWAAMRFYATLIRATNRAWGASTHRWWRLPFKSFVFLGMSGIVVAVALLAPTLAELATTFLFPATTLAAWASHSAAFFLRIAVVFSALSLFYKTAPRRPTQFSEVWSGALIAALLLQAAGGLFIVYLKHFATFNALYGSFSGVVALLLWIYISGCIFIYGACWCATLAQSNQRRSR